MSVAHTDDCLPPWSLRDVILCFLHVAEWGFRVEIRLGGRLTENLHFCTPKFV